MTSATTMRRAARRRQVGLAVALGLVATFMSAGTAHADTGEQVVSGAETPGLNADPAQAVDGPPAQGAVPDDTAAPVADAPTTDAPDVDAQDAEPTAPDAAPTAPDAEPTAPDQAQEPATDPGAGTADAASAVDAPAAAPDTTEVAPEPSVATRAVLACRMQQNPATSDVPATDGPAEVELLNGVQQGTFAFSGAVEGVATIGVPLTVTPNDDWLEGTEFTYEWMVGGQTVPGGLASYTPTAADLGQLIYVSATGTQPCMDPMTEYFSANLAPATPVVSVGSSTIEVTTDAEVPITVTGPVGGPVPTGTVTVTVVAPDAEETTLDPVDLTVGAASVVLSDLPVGLYTVRADYTSDPMWNIGVATFAPELHAYTDASGTGTVDVVRVTPQVTAPAGLTVAVATAGGFTATVSGRVLPTTWLLREGATVLGTGALAPDGVLVLTLPVLSPGTHTLVLDLPETASTSAASATVTVAVAGEPPRATSTPTATLATPAGASRPGQTMDLVAAGFVPGETVAFFLYSDPVLLGTAVAGADGVARLTGAVVPANAALGRHTVVATGGASGRWAVLAVDLAAPRATPRTLAATGVDPGALLLLVGLALVGGAALVHVARRRHPRD